MFGINLFDNDTPLTGIDKHFDNLSYFAHRDIVYEARKGTLKEQYPLFPYTQNEVLEFAFRDKEENFAGASYNALAGAENHGAIMGKPAINPVTGQENSEESQKSILDSAKDGATKLIEDLGTKAFIGAGIAGSVYLIAKKNDLI